MNRYCSVPQCSSWRKKDTSVHFHKFPQPGKKFQVWVEGNSGMKVLTDRQTAWQLKLKIGKPITKFMQVCSLHFTDDDYFYRGSSSNHRKLLKWNAVPSRNLPVGSVVKEEPGCSNVRAERLKQRRMNKIIIGEECSCEESIPAAQTASADEIEAAQGLLQLLQSQPDYNGPKTFNDFEVQVNTSQVSTLCDLITTDSALNSFTGVNIKLLDTIVQAVQSVHKDQRLHRLNIKQSIVLVLTKMKCDLTYVMLSILFGIPQKLCQQYIYEMLPLLSKVLSCVIKFPDFCEIQRHMPKCFENFQNTRVVLDCTEFFIQKPKCLCCRIRFYSLKSNNTVKVMTGVSPGGLITFISEPYGGRASDKTIFLQSNLISKLESSRDAIMVDKGFSIDEICHQFKIELIRPPFLKDKKQMSRDEALSNAKIAAARVHTES